MNDAIELVLSAILTLVALVVQFIGIADFMLGAVMARLGLPHPVQIIFLVVCALWLVGLAFRLLGRVFAALIIVLLLMMVVHPRMHGVKIPDIRIPSTFQNIGGVHI